MSQASLLSASAAALLPGLLIAALAASAGAQELGDGSRGGGLGLGLGVVIGLPQGAFGRNVDPSFGLGASLFFDLGAHTDLGLRIDGSMVYYGSETQDKQLVVHLPGLFTDVHNIDVTTRNRIGSLLAGPQLTFEVGDVRPYLHLGAGFSYFWTGVDYELPWEDDDHQCEDWDDDGQCDEDIDFGKLALFFEGETLYDHWAFAWTAGGGVDVVLSRSVTLFLGAQWLENGRVRYLREGDVREHPDGSYSFTPVESSANLLLLQIGVRVTG